MSRTTTRRVELGVLDLSKLHERILVDLQTTFGVDPINARIELTRQSGWSTQPIKVRRWDQGNESDLPSAVSMAVPTANTKSETLDAEQLIGVDVLSIGADAVEASSKIEAAVIATVPLD